MILAAVPARTALSTCTRFLVCARHRHGYVEAVVTHRRLVASTRPLYGEPLAKRREGRKRSAESKADSENRRPGHTGAPSTKRRVPQPKASEIAYEPYWEDACIRELEKAQPELVVRGTVVIPAFATAEAKVVRHAHDPDSDCKIISQDEYIAEKHSNGSGSRKQVQPGGEGGSSEQKHAESRDAETEACEGAFVSNDQAETNERDRTRAAEGVRIFGFLARNRAFHGDEVVALRQRRLRQPPGEAAQAPSISEQCRVVRITKRSPALKSFVGVLDAEACLNAQGQMVKCQPQDTRWPAFSVRVDQISREIMQRIGELRSKGRLFCLMQFEDWKEHEMEPSGSVTSVIGGVSDPSARMQASMIFHGLNPNGFSDSVMEDLKQLVERGELAKDKNRVDRRDLLVFTIDPQDAKDLDDALSVEAGKDELGRPRYTIGVHIADVSHYVQGGSLVDLDARQRATSVYLEHRVYPMLPQYLSENLCSLTPHSEKLCFSMFADLGENSCGGELVGNNLYIRNQRFVLTRIVSSERLSYQTAKEMISRRLEAGAGLTAADLESMSISQFHKAVVESGGGAELSDAATSTAEGLHRPEAGKSRGDGGTPPSERAPLGDSEVSSRVSTPLLVLYFISRKLRHFRLKHRGAVTVDINGSHKCHIPQVGESTGRLWVEQIPRESHELVEEMMLLANTQAAQLLAKSFDRYFLRVHENTSRAIKQLVTSMMPQELRKRINPEILHIPELLRKCAKHMEATAFQSLSFAALQQFKEAVYSPVNKDDKSAQGVTGHWGLALPMYLHFTSPIRRYSDLYTHRMLKTVIDGTYTEQSLKVLDEICKQCNLQKRKAFDVQKEYKNFAFNQYLQWACTAEDGSEPYAAADQMFAKAFTGGGDAVWGLAYDYACVFSIVLNDVKAGDGQNKTSIVFYIPLLNEQRSVSCDSLHIKPLEAVVGGERVKLRGEGAGDQARMVDAYLKEVQSASAKHRQENANVQSLTFCKGGRQLTLSHYQKLRVVLIPGSLMWTLRLPAD
ncbi:ribonuclease R [Babesia caballi]|uniref:Ribonuclease R n=1 Tax=Babesia caballi TaxID=5871 RepID=A0AAV4M217_BABCB|nr:ribonuclease R [Babesia caballi]